MNRNRRKLKVEWLRLYTACRSNGWKHVTVTMRPGKHMLHLKTLPSYYALKLLKKLNLPNIHRFYVS